MFPATSSFHTSRPLSGCVFQWLRVVQFYLPSVKYCVGSRRVVLNSDACKTWPNTFFKFGERNLLCICQEILVISLSGGSPKFTRTFYGVNYSYPPNCYQNQMLTPWIFCYIEPQKFVFTLAKVGRNTCTLIFLS